MVKNPATSGGEVDAFEPFTEKRPWGQFRQLTPSGAAGQLTVKILTVKKGEMFSLQSHRKRTEFWHVLSGTPEVTIGNVAASLQVTHAKIGDEFTVSPGLQHRIAAPSGDTEILEISSGTFDENDIVRLEDKYGRV